MIAKQHTAESVAAGGPRAPHGRRVYAIGDIHGRIDLLRQLHRRMHEDAAAAPGVDKVVVYLGDYVDRGPGSFAVVDLLLHEPLAGFEAVHLRGNHEDLLLRFYADGTAAATWFMNGGVATLESYGVDVSDLLSDIAAPTTMWRRFRRLLPPTHLDFFRRLKTRHEEGDYLFVHAGVRPGVALADQREADLLWIRGDFLDSDEDFGKVVVHGHSISAEPEVRANRIGIDTGAFYSDRLTCLVIEGETRRFLAT